MSTNWHVIKPELENTKIETKESEKRPKKNDLNTEGENANKQNNIDQENQNSY